MKPANEPLGVWRAGVLLARQTRLPAKLGILSATVVIPLFVVSVILAQRHMAEVAQTRAELDGVAVIRPLTQVIALVQKHGGQSSILLSGNEAIKPELETTRAELVQAVADALAAVKMAKSSELFAKWQPLMARLSGLTPAAKTANAAVSFDAHGGMVRDLRHLVFEVGEISGLLYDSEPVAYLLMDMVVSRNLAWMEQLGQLRSAGADLLARAEVDSLSGAGIRARAVKIADLLAEQRPVLDVIRRKGEQGLGDDVAMEATQRFTAKALEAFPVAAVAARDPTAFFAEGTRAIDSVLAAQARMTDRLDAQLKRRSDGLNLQLIVGVSGTVVGLLALFYIFTSFYKSISIDLRRMSFAMKQLAEGNLRVVGTARSRDEIGDIAVILGRMIHNMSAMVAAVGSDSALVAHAGRELSAGNRDLADRTEQQATNLEQTSASVAELAATVGQNADAAGEVDRQAVQVRDIAETGANAMLAAVESVEAIQRSAHRMNEIIGVIDGLAFQTNILALNAAVEAARAGESGRGFAVVASEVRSLAQRSAENAREIRSLIQASSTQVESSVSQIRLAGDGMTRILSGIRKVVQAAPGIPVIGNGDVTTPEAARVMLQETGCAGVSIGRGAFYNPWIFTHTRRYLDTGVLPPEPKFEERIRVMREHLARMVEVFGEVHACRMFRKVAPWYSKRFGPSSEFNKKVVLLTSLAHFEEILGGYIEWRCQFLDDSGELKPAYRPAALAPSFIEGPVATQREKIPVPKGPVEVW